MRTRIIYTRIAGGGQGEARFLACRDAIDGEAICARAGGEAAAAARAAAGEVDLLVAAGGDGTVHEVINGLMAAPEPRPRLAILPLGTGNDIARNLRILTVEDTFSALRESQFRALDLIRVRLTTEAGEAVVYAGLNCAVGFGAAVIRATTTRVKRLFGPRWAYTVGTLRALRAWRSPAMSLRWESGSFDGRVLFLGVGNGEWESGGTMRISPGARADDGQLDLLLIRHGSKLEVLRNFTKINTGEHIHHPLVDYFPLRRLEVRAERVLEIQADGDIIGRSPATIEVVPAALQVAAPPMDTAP